MSTHGLDAPATIDLSRAFNPLGKRSLIALVISTAAAGPVMLATLTVWMTLDPMAPTHSSFELRDALGYLVLTLTSIVGGSFASLPAIALNCLIHTGLTRYRLDALGWSIASGAALGAPFGYWLDYLTVIGSDYEPNVVVMYPGAVVGILVNSLYWFIALRPLRQARLRAVNPQRSKSTAH